ncbi:MAG: FHA domain-containing protein, partial [Deltaproteobacteria bacterium]|nr:FHA domain-containing protein [Deltaproteobacteria bacterium]
VVLFEDVFGQLYNAAEGAAEGEGATWPLEAFAELVTIMLKAEENGVHFPKLDRLREQALALAARAPRPESSTRGPEPVLRDPDAGSGNNWAGPIGDLAGILLAGAKRLMGIKSRPEAKPEATPPPRQPQDAQILSWTRHERALLETLYQHIRAIENLRKTGIEKHGALRDAIDQGDPLRLLQVLASLPDIAWNLTPWREDMGESRYVNSQRYDPQYRVFVATLYLKVRRGMQRGEVAISEAALEQLTEAAGSSLREAEEIAQGRQQSEAQSEPPQQQNRFPKAAAFFAERYPGISFSPDRPREMLKLLVHPREEVWVQGKYVKVDPVGKPGYAEAVRELAQAVMPEYAAGKEDGEYEFNPLPFGTLEALTPTPLVEKELRRLLAGSRDVIGQRLARWRENGNGESGTQTPSAPGTSPGTHFMVYDRAVRGGRESGVNKRQSEPSMDGWDWGAREELGYGPVGRLYIGVRADAADTFWAAFKSEVLDLAEQKGTPCQSKISQSRRRLEAAGDNTVLYFRAEDEMFFYNVVVQFMRRHEGAGWFHTLEMDRRPILAAQVFDSQGRPVAGLSFGQHPGPQRSFNGVRADAVARALRQERLLDVLGQFDYFSPRERLRFRMQLILREFQREGIDIENPAFQRDGRKNFPTIYKRTDQGGAQSGPASLAVRLDPEAGSGNSGGGPIGDLVEVLWYGAKRLFGIKPKSQEAPRWNIPALVRSLEAVDPELKARRGIGWGSFPAAKKINEADFLGLLEMELSATSGAIQQEGADLGTVRMDWSKVTPKTRQRAQVVLGMMQMALTAGEDVREGKQGVADDYQLVKDCVDRFPPPKPEEAASIPSGNGNKSVAGVTEDPKIPPPPRLLAPLGASYQSPALPQMEVITLGRNPDSIVSLTDERVSKRHARIFLNANKRWVLEDLRSKNGTFVNDQAIDRPTVLKDGDVIRIGPYEWTVGNGMDNEAGSAEMRGLKPQGPMARPVPTPSPSAVDAPRAEPVTLKILGNPPEGTFVNPVVRIQTQAGEAAATSDPGRGGKEKGKPDNEDGAALVQGPSGNLHLAIFDGMGGYDDADMATRLGIEAFARSASAGGSSEEALREADRQIRGYNEAQSVLERHPVEAGAVAAAAMITPEGVLTVHWAGDARVVVLRPGEDGRYRLIFRTLDETKGAHAVQEGNSPLTQAVIEETDHSVRSNLGDFYGRVHLRGTKQGLVPDDSEAGFRFAEELKGGMLLEEGDIVIGGSDGLWGNLPQNKGRLEVELNDILGPSHSPDSGTKGLRGEIHHRMELYRQGYLAIKEAAAAAGVDDGFYRAPITYKGTSTYLKAQSRLFIDEYGNVWDSPSGGNVVDSFALDHFSVFVHEQGPR